MEQTNKKKPHPLLDQVSFTNLGEERCVQMMHTGPYDAEPASFARMEKLKTVLRFGVK